MSGVSLSETFEAVGAFTSGKCSEKDLKEWEDNTSAINKNIDVIRTIDNPYSEYGGIAVLKGNIAKNGCIAKRSAVASEMMVKDLLLKPLIQRKRQLKLSIIMKL